MIIVVILFGWLSGVLINYVSDVLPHTRRLVQPFCVNCEKPQPIINYLFWPRRCPHCSHWRTRRSWIVEILTIFIALWLWAQPSLVLGFWLSLVVMVYFGIVVIIDLEHHLIMHPISIFGSILGLVIGIQLHGLLNTLIGGIAGFGAMLVLYFLGALFARFIVRRSREGFSDEALGFGDVILGGILGLILGWPAIIGGLFIAIILAGAISLIFLILTVLARKYNAFTFIPYGPFMIAGAAALIFFNTYFVSAFGG
jgi:prepilin signal peptidase PulO-like enzyme (type II secretory pathway)